MNLLKKFKFKTAPLPEMEKYHGRTVIIEGSPVVIERIVGSAFFPKHFEINGEHMIGMLRFFAQMNGDRSITEDQFKAFEDMDLHVEKTQAGHKNETQA